MDVATHSVITEVDPEVEILFDPLRWRAPLGCVPVDSNLNPREKLVSTLRQQTDWCRSNVTDMAWQDLGVQYGNPSQPEEGSEAFDWYAPASFHGDECHVLVYLHGGFWRSLDLQESSHWASPVLKCGAVYVAMGYGLVPHQSISVTREQLCKGFNKVYSHTCDALKRICPGRLKVNLHIFGHSAGAHLALETIAHAYQNLAYNHTWLSSVRSLILVSCLCDLRPLLHTSFNVSLRFQSEQDAWLISPFRYFPDASFVRRLNAKWLIAWAEYDPPGFAQQADDLVRYLKDLNSEKVESFFIINEDHFSTVERLFFGPGTSKLFEKVIEFIGL